MMTMGVSEPTDVVAVVVVSDIILTRLSVMMMMISKDGDGNNTSTSSNVCDNGLKGGYSLDWIGTVVD
jgi:hypothetical protein